jgi:hypothetical protein
LEIRPGGDGTGCPTIAGMARSKHPVLTLARLNRATLARQLLLEPATLDPVRAIEQVGGFQAQEPASPYIGLWTRLAEFAPAELDRAFRERRVIKATLMRSTLHAATRDDYVGMLPAILPMLRVLWRTSRLPYPGAEGIEALAAAALDYASEPRTNIQMRDYVGRLAGDFPADDAWWWVRRHAPFVHVPSAVPWSFGRRPSLAGAPSWLAGGAFVDEDASLRHVVRRHLGAFGPARLADVSAWSGLPVARLRPAIEAIEAADGLRRFSDEAGRELVDLPDAPIPEAGIPAPPRLLPMWDSVLLAHADRTRILADEHRRLVIARNGDVLPSFLVDGRVAGLWWTEPDGPTTRVVLEPFGRLPRPFARELERAGARLAAFVGPLEPRVYARYRQTRARRPTG